MKWLILIGAGLRRNRLRALLTGISIAIAFLLIGGLQVFASGMQRAVQALHADRLVMTARYVRTEQLSIRSLPVIQQTEGVAAVTHLSYFGGFYQERKNRIAATVTTPELFEIHSEWQVPPEQLDEFRRIRTGAIIGTGLAEKFGWRLGSRIPLQSRLWVRRDGSYLWPLDVVGIYRSNADDQNMQLFLNYSYFDESRVANTGLVDRFIVRATSEEHAASLARVLDGLFAYAERQTETLSEREQGERQLRRLGNIRFIVNAITGAVLFTLLYLTGNVMLQAFRERRPEFAVLKAAGFSDWQLLLLICLESVLICVLAALLGLAATFVLFRIVAPTAGEAQFSIAPYLQGLAMALTIAVAATIVPAWQLGHSSVASALARR